MLAELNCSMCTTAIAEVAFQKQSRQRCPVPMNYRYMLLKKPDSDAREGCFLVQMLHYEEYCCLTAMFVAVAAAQYCYLTILFVAAQINDRYEFPEELDLDAGDGRFLAADADRSVRNLYRLHSVLVHSGGVHGGHYYAFIRPDGRQWLKFDDDKARIPTLLEFWHSDSITEACASPACLTGGKAGHRVGLTQNMRNSLT